MRRVIVPFKRPWSPAAGVAAVVFAFALGVAGTRVMAGQAAGSESPALDTFRAAFEVTRDRYVDESQADPDQLVRDAINGMVEGLGDTGHSRYMTAEQRQREKQALSGVYVGIGVQMAERDGRPVIASAFPDSPAAQAGLGEGDRILSIDGQDVSALSLADLSPRLRGPAGSEVTLTVSRPDSTTSTVTIQRREIDLPFVTWAPIGDSSLWHIRLSRFGQDVADELDQALAAAAEAGATGIVLDLRGNPGGLLNQAVEVAGRFVEDGAVLIERDRGGGEHTVNVKDESNAVSLPVVVLVDRGSASSSEVVAAALRYHDRAAIVGENTFGTATVLREFGLPDGSSILLGVVEWLTPAGEPLRGRGITPDQIVTRSEGVSPLVPAVPGAPAEDVCAAQDAQLHGAAAQLGLTCPTS